MISFPIPAHLGDELGRETVRFLGRGSPVCGTGAEVNLATGTVQEHVTGSTGEGTVRVSCILVKPDRASLGSVSQNVVLSELRVRNGYVRTSEWLREDSGCVRHHREDAESSTRIGRGVSQFYLSRPSSRRGGQVKQDTGRGTRVYASRRDTNQ